MEIPCRLSDLDVGAPPGSIREKKPIELTDVREDGSLRELLTTRMTDYPKCTLSILAGPGDLPFFAPIVRHLVRVNQFPFAERILVVDAEQRKGPHPPNHAELLDRFRAECEDLRKESVVDTIVDLDLRRDRAWHRRLAERHFQKSVRETRDFRGVPLFGWIASLEHSDVPYHLHFDSDILLHQEPDFCWIREAIRVLRERPDVMFVSPLPGPPTKNGELNQPGATFRHEDGLFLFKTFSSRRFLLDRSRFNALLPLDFAYASRRHRVLSYLNGKSGVCNWEQMVGAALARSKYFRAHLDSPNAWSLHAPDHGPRFVEMLDVLTSTVESGRFPQAQAGNYDLNLDLWESFLTSRAQAE